MDLKTKLKWSFTSGNTNRPNFQIFYPTAHSPYPGPRLGAGPRLGRPQWSYPVHSTFHFIVLFTNRVKSTGQIGVGVSQGHPNVEWFLGQSPPWRPPLLSFPCPLKFLRAASPAAPEPFYKGRWILGEQSGTRAGAPSVCVNLSSDHTHDFLLYLGVLSINVGIAHLPILVSAKDRASVSTREQNTKPCLPAEVFQDATISSQSYRFYRCSSGWRDQLSSFSLHKPQWSVLFPKGKVPVPAKLDSKGQNSDNKNGHPQQSHTIYHPYSSSNPKGFF